MSDLSTQLRAYGRQLDEAAAPLPDTLDPAATRRPRRIARPGAVVAVAAALTITVIGGLAWLLGGDASTQPVVDQTENVAPTTAEEQTQLIGTGPWDLRRLAEPPPMSMLDDLWAGSDGRLYASGDTGTWVSSDGESWQQAAAVPRGWQSASFNNTFALVTEAGSLRVTFAGGQWASPDLPRDIVATSEAITLHYSAEDVAVGPLGMVVQGFATSNADPAAVKAAYPELGPITEVSRVAPCGPGGEPLPCDLDDDDALWVTVAGEETPQAVSLSGMGLSEADIWRAYRVVWFSADGIAFETAEHRVLTESGYGPDPSGLVATESGFVMIDGGVWISPDGVDWVEQAAPPYDISELFTVGSRVLGYTHIDEVVEFHADGSWTLEADTASIDRTGLDHVAIEAVTDRAFVAIGYQEMFFPDIAGDEPLSTARVIGISADGVSWTTVSLESALGASGAVEVAAAGDYVVVVIGPGQPEELEMITEPEWWIGTISDLEP
jgi:hypothetical protein